MVPACRLKHPEETRQFGRSHHFPDDVMHRDMLWVAVLTHWTMRDDLSPVHHSPNLSREDKPQPFVRADGGLRADQGDVFF